MEDLAERSRLAEDRPAGVQVELVDHYTVEVGTVEVHSSQMGSSAGLRTPSRSWEEY